MADAAKTYTRALLALSGDPLLEQTRNDLLTSIGGDDLRTVVKELLSYRASHTDHALSGRSDMDSGTSISTSTDQRRGESDGIDCVAKCKRYCHII